MTRWRAWVALVVPFVLAAVGAATAAAAPGDVRASFDAPCKYPTGLATDGQQLYVLDWREARIHVVAPADGRLARSLPAPTLRPHGLTWGGGRLYVSDDRTGWIYAIDPQTGAVAHSFEGPGERVTGLAYADDGLWLLERRRGQIHKVVPADGTILTYFPAPNDSCTSLAFDGRYLWSADRVKNEIYLIDPADGTVLGILDAPAPYAAGLAWLDGHLWNVDFQTRKLYQLVVRDRQKYRLTDTRQARVEFLWGLYNYGPGDVRDLSLAIAVPGPLPQQELLSAVEFSRPPTRNVTDQWGQPCAWFEIDTLPAGRRETLTCVVSAKVSAIRYLIFPDECGTLADIPADIRQQYTADAARYRITAPAIRDAVRQVVGDEQNPCRIVRKLYNYVIEKLEYEMVGGWDVPEVVLKRGKGSCSEYTFTLIALCRAAGVPARYVGSVVVRGDDASIDEAFHRWAEVYLPNYGWVPVDANRGDQKAPADQARGFGQMANTFLITTHGGGASQYLDWNYNAFARYGQTGYAKIEEETLAFWEPLAPTTAPAVGPGALECRPEP